MSRILVVAAHPDDEVFGCGGTMARLVWEGHDVHIAILGAGALARNDAGVTEVSMLREGACLAAKLLNASRLEPNEIFPDNAFDTIPLLRIVKAVERAIVLCAPEIIFTHHIGDLNIDHELTRRAVVTAARPGLTTVREVYAFEVPSATDWAFGQKPFVPDTFYDITATLNRKIEILDECYSAEMRPAPHPRSAPMLRARALSWGAVAGCDAAEAFMTVRRML